MWIKEVLNVYLTFLILYPLAGYATSHHSRDILFGGSGNENYLNGSLYSFFYLVAAVKENDIFNGSLYW